MARGAVAESELNQANIREVLLENGRSWPWTMMPGSLAWSEITIRKVPSGSTTLMR